MNAGRGLLVTFAIAVALTALFTTARLARMDWNATGMADVGEVFVADRAAVPEGLKIWPGAGYDGQFYYRLALDPTNFGTVSHGLELDSRVRLNRIGYPATAWAVAGGGNERAVPWALIALNVLGVGVLAVLGGLAAREAGRDPRWGLLVAGFGGFVIAVARDLTEVTAACFLLAGLLLARRERYGWAGMVLGAAVLTRESTLVVVLALAAAWAVELLRGARRFHAAAAWTIPLLVAVAWQAVVAADVGSLPFLANRGNLTLPFATFVPDAAGWLVGRGRPGLALPELAVLAFLLFLAGQSLRRSLIPLGEKVAWALALLVAVSLGHDTFEGPADFRRWSELYVLTILVLLGDPSRRLRWPGVLVAATWAAVGAFHLVVLS